MQLTRSSSVYTKKYNVEQKKGNRLTTITIKLELLTKTGSVCTKKYKSEMKKKSVKWKLKKLNGTRSTFHR
ncbi:hypothetical protein P4391_28360 [Bacillus thuringiensis]|nr:hypothetical protein [Bacillus thuringiensis]EEM95354.1 NADH dehydrogenase subunit 5 [Bacillus thuringiensis IBL 200]MED2623085.1 hypothetical protein [Bacillus thuringiensis]MED3242448.1 hypothetical protein [Bacillus thuringiensis]MED3301269.1 hypothetical protein [Bacillus thuringiensis]MED3598938.1 hypothetical protein [Bacillus thuringiensis]